MKITVNGRTVYQSQGNRRTGKKCGDEKARAQLQARYPGATFSGDYNRIKIDMTVRIGRGTQIIQTGEAEIEVRGNSTIGRDVRLATGDEAAGKGNSVTIKKGGHSIVVSGGNVSISSSGGSTSVSLGRGKPSKLVLNNATLEDGAKVEGTDISLTNTTMKSNGEIIVTGSSKLADRGSTISSTIKTRGSGGVDMEEAEINEPISVQGSGDVSVEKSKVNAPISVMGSGDVEISKQSTIEAGISIMGSGDVKIRNSTVRSPINVMGHRDASLIDDGMSSG